MKGHTEYQILNFIINANGPHIYGRYRQCIREIAARMTNLDPRELLVFYDIYLQLKEQIGDQDLKILEAEFWTEKLKRRLALEILTQGRPSYGTLETIWNMPNFEEMFKFIDSIAAPAMAKKYILDQKAQPLKLKYENIKELWLGDTGIRKELEEIAYTFKDSGEKTREKLGEDRSTGLIPSPT